MQLQIELEEIGEASDPAGFRRDVELLQPSGVEIVGGRSSQADDEMSGAYLDVLSVALSGIGTAAVSAVASAIYRRMRTRSGDRSIAIWREGSHGLDGLIVRTSEGTAVAVLVVESGENRLSIELESDSDLEDLISSLGGKGESG